eukprot:TRINITY_DN3068_c0_g2_i1.p1 TRINITY_DN3068_c0_g2~~TRINITY_DN3068_c0_g2_i1.p1  ORF type:complete len:398 (+),score=69.66 TRINITY_DN3068_c0_g2_i1:120-1313(+)
MDLLKDKLSEEDWVSLGGNRVSLLAEAHKTKVLPAISSTSGSDTAQLGHALRVLCDPPLQTAYSDYINHYDNASALWHKIGEAHSADLTQLLGEHPVSAFASLLIAPVQRFPRYALLVRDLIAYSDATADAAPELFQVQTAIEAVVSSLNAQKQKFADQQLVIDITAAADAELSELLATHSSARQPHVFEKRVFSKPLVTCARCARSMIFKKGMCCTNCDMQVHAACVSQVPASCLSRPLTDDDFTHMLAASMQDAPDENSRVARMATRCRYVNVLSGAAADEASDAIDACVVLFCRRAVCCAHGRRRQLHNARSAAARRLHCRAGRQRARCLAAQSRSAGARAARAALCVGGSGAFAHHSGAIARRRTAAQHAQENASSHQNTPLGQHCRTHAAPF